MNSDCVETTSKSWQTITPAFWESFVPGQLPLSELVTSFRDLCHDRYQRFQHLDPNNSQVKLDFLHDWLNHAKFVCGTHILFEEWASEKDLQYHLPWISLFLSPTLAPIVTLLPKSLWENILNQAKRDGIGFAYYTLPTEHPRPEHWPSGPLRMTPLHALRAILVQHFNFVKTFQEGLSSHPLYQNLSVISLYDKIDILAHLHDMALHHEVAHLQENKTPTNISLPTLSDSVPTFLEEHLVAMDGYGMVDFSHHFLGRPHRLDAWFEDPKKYPNDTPWNALGKREQDVFRRLFTQMKMPWESHLSYWDHMASQPRHPQTIEPLTLDPLPSSRASFSRPLGMLEQLYALALADQTDSNPFLNARVFGSVSLERRTLSPLTPLFHVMGQLLPSFFDARRTKTFYFPQGELFQQRREQMSSPALDWMEEMLGLAAFAFYKTNPTLSHLADFSYHQPDFFLPIEAKAWLQQQRQYLHIEAFLNDREPTPDGLVWALSHWLSSGASSFLEEYQALDMEKRLEQHWNTSSDTESEILSSAPRVRF